MPNILFLTQWYPSSKSPVEGIFIWEHAHAAALFNRVEVIHIQGIENPSDPVKGSAVHDDSGIITYHLVYAKSRVPKTTWYNKIRDTNRLVHSLMRSPTPPEIIHANVYNTAGLAVYLGKQYRLPVILSEHASTYARNLFSRTQAYQIRFWLNQIQLILPVCENLKSQMLRYGIHGPYLCVPNTVDPEVFFPQQTQSSRQPGRYRLLTVAGLYPVKGVDSLLRSLAELQKVRSDFELTIVGDGPERRSLQELAAFLEISSRVYFVGHVEKSGIAKLMRNADLMVLTSRWDNQPVALLEAMACGLPVLASNVGGIPEIVKPFCGALVPPGDVEGISQGLSQMLDHIHDFDPFRIAEYAAQAYSYQAVGKIFSDIYTGIANKENDRDAFART